MALCCESHCVGLLSIWVRFTFPVAKCTASSLLVTTDSCSVFRSWLLSRLTLFSKGHLQLPRTRDTRQSGTSAFVDTWENLPGFCSERSTHFTHLYPLPPACPSCPSLSSGCLPLGHRNRGIFSLPLLNPLPPTHSLQVTNAGI